MTPLIIASLIPAVQAIIERVVGLIPDPKAREQARMEALQETAKLIASSDAGQVTVNAAEAESSNWFVSGARPFIMWTCGFSLAVEFLARPLLAWSFPDMTPMPQADEELWIVVTGILGLGTMRTVERLNGVARR